MTLRRLAAVFAFVVFAGPAFAAPSTLTVAAAHAAADEFIQQANAEGVFENITTTEAPAVRHIASGLTCTFDPGQPVRLLLYDGLPRGDDVSCGSTYAGAIHTLYATRPGRAVALEEAFQGYVAQVQQVSPNAAPFEGQMADVEDFNLPPRRTARFEVNLAGRGPRQFSRLSVAIVGDWVIEQRLTGPLDKALAMDLLGEAMMTSALRNLVAQAR